VRGTTSRVIVAFRNMGNTIGDVARSVIRAVNRFVDRNRDDLNALGRAARAVFNRVKDVVNTVLVPAFRAAVGPIKNAVGGIIQALRGLVRIVSGILTGDWRRVWRGAKDVVVGAGRLVVGTIRGLGGAIGAAMVGLAKLGIRAFKRGFESLPGAVKDAIISGVKKGISAATGGVSDIIGDIGDLVGDGIGKKIGDGVGKKAAGSVGGAAIPKGGGGGLMGANPALGGFVSIAHKMGLRVSSGKRAAGGLTNAGNVSYHGSGEAVDIADGTPGPSPAKLRFARYMKAKFGRRLAELIYTPMGSAIKDGRSVAPYAQADHMDHVHVALDLGRPGAGIGDGIGKRAFMGDGPGKMGPLRMIADAAGKSGISPAILYGVWGAESNFSMGPGPTSPAGAQGPFQFMPATAKSMGVNPANFRSAVYGAARYLGQYKSRGVDRMLLAYNAGPAGSMNPESARYIPKVKAIAGRWASVAPKGAGGGGGSGGGGGGGEDEDPKPRLTPEQRVEKRRQQTLRTREKMGLMPGGFGGGLGNLGVLVSPDSPAGLELGLAQADEMLARAEGTDDLEDDRRALKKRLTFLRGRLKKINRSLKRTKGGQGMKAETVGRLLAEAAQLRRDIRETMAALRALGVTSADQAAEADAIQASLTPDLQDDLRVAQTDLARREADYAKAKRSGNKARIIETGQALSTARQNVQSAQEAITAAGAGSALEGLNERLELVDLQERAGDLTPEQANAQRIHLRTQALAGYFGPLTDRERLQVRGDLRENTQALQDLNQAFTDYTNALKTLTDEVALSNRISQSVQSTDSFQLKKVLADIFSGQIGGYGLVARSFTPGNGVEHAY
jgi:hypothetical protein